MQTSSAFPRAACAALVSFSLLLAGTPDAAAITSPSVTQSDNVPLNQATDDNL
jgi:hypothetical protein